MNDKEKQQYWDGSGNRSIRYYFYIQKGLLVLNEFRYIIFAVLAIYALLKIDNPLVMLGMFLVSVPVLLFLGWLYVHKMAKVMDYLNIQFSTHFSRYSVELQEQQLKKLTGILDKLNDMPPEALS